MIDLPPSLGLLTVWYVSGVYVALLLGMLICIWIYFDANRKGARATIPLTIGIISTILIVPSAIIALSTLNWLLRDWNLVITMGYLGLMGAVGVIFAGFAYALGIGVEAPLPSPPPIGPTIPVQPRVVETARPRATPLERTKYMGERVAPVAWLVPKTGSRQGQQIGLSRGPNTIGRNPSCNVVVEDGTVSGEHARIQFENGQFVIYDLASLNGTFVNGRRVQRQLLMDGDEIKLGESVFVFKKV